jgi:hypothetical protein
LYSERVDLATEQLPRKRPVVITVVMILVVLSGLSNALLGIVVLLSRYQVPDADVLPVSLIGAAVILFGLLTLAVAAAVGRGSRLARLLLTIYLTIQLVLHAVTAATTDWDWAVFAQAAVEALLLVALWAPPGSRHFADR